RLHRVRVRPPRHPWPSPRPQSPRPEPQQPAGTVRRPGGITPCSPTARFHLTQAEAQHRDHTIIEQVLADLAAGPLAHLPSGVFTANAAWLTLAATTHNLLRAAGTLTSTFHARARGATLRAHLINIPARIARGHITL